MDTAVTLAIIVFLLVVALCVYRTLLTKREKKRVMAARLEATRKPAVTPESPYAPPPLSSRDFNKQVPITPRKPDPLSNPRPARPKINPSRLRDDDIHTHSSWPDTTTYGGSSGWSGGGASYDTSSDSGSSGGGGSDGGGGGGGGE